MQIINSVFLINTWKSFFAIRIPGRTKAFIMLYVGKGSCVRISLRIWKIKFSLELG